MPYQVEVKGEDGHTFEVTADSIIELPALGQKVKCGVCKKETRVKKVGIASRSTPREEHPTSSGQTKITK